MTEQLVSVLQLLPQANTAKISPNVPLILGKTFTIVHAICASLGPRMKTITIVLALACLGQSAPTKKHVILQDADSYETEYVSHRPLLETVEAHYIDAAPAATHKGEHRTGYSVGGGLVSIAQGAADQAHTQLGNQHSAAGQAAYVAKNTLAQAAAQSAATAAAALAGKQIIVMGLEQQSADAHNAVNGEKMQLQQAQRAATASQNTAQQAMHQVQVITAALNAAQATAEHAGQAASEAAAELAAQTTMVGQAKTRAEAIDEQLHLARIDFEATQAAAQKAASAAQTAQSNAAAAAAHAAHAAAATVTVTSAPSHRGSSGLHEAAEALTNALPGHADTGSYEYSSYRYI